MCLSTAKVNMGIDQFMVTLLNQENRHIWDMNYDSGENLKQVGAGV
jgi:hypothetical protein